MSERTKTFCKLFIKLSNIEAQWINVKKVQIVYSKIELRPTLKHGTELVFDNKYRSNFLPIVYTNSFHDVKKPSKKSFSS